MDIRSPMSVDHEEVGCLLKLQRPLNSWKIRARRVWKRRTDSGDVDSNRESSWKSPQGPNSSRYGSSRIRPPCVSTFLGCSIRASTTRGLIRTSTPSPTRNATTEVWDSIPMHALSRSGRGRQLRSTSWIAERPYLSLPSSQVLFACPMTVPTSMTTPETHPLDFQGPLLCQQHG